MILHVSSTATEAMKGGVQSYVRSLAEWQRARGLEVVELVRRAPGEYEVAEGVEEVSAPAVLRRIGAGGMALRGRVRAAMAAGATICVHYLPHILFTPELIWSGRYTMYFHGPGALEARSEGRGRLYCWLVREMERFVYGRCGRFVCLSEAFRRILTEEYGVPAERVTVIPGHLSLEQERELGRRAARDQRPVRQFVSVRRLRERMGLDVLVEAFAIARRQAAFEDCRLQIVGEGPLRESLERRARELGVGDVVEFRGGVKDGERDRILRESDCFVLPTRELEGFGMVLLEAMRAELHVIASEVGGIPEVLGRVGLTECLVPARDAEALARKMVEYRMGGGHRLPSEGELRREFSLRVLGERHLRVVSEGLCGD